MKELLKKLWVVVSALLLGWTLFACGAAPVKARAHVQTDPPLYTLRTVVRIPHFNAQACFDIAEVDGNTLYLSDTINKAVDVIARGRVMQMIGQGLFQGVAGCAHFDFSQQGPSGIGIEHNHLWASDGNATVKVFDLTGKWLATIPTGNASDKRADEFDYIPTTHQIVVGNPDAPEPFLSYIDTLTFKVMHRQFFADATAGLEQPRYANGLLYQALPATKTNPGGEVDVINPSTYAIVARYATPQCAPNGLVIDHRQAVLGCGNGPGEILNLATGKVSVVKGSSASDMVAVDAQRGHVFFASVPGATVFVTDTQGRILQTIATDPRAHSVAVDPVSGELFIPMGSRGGVAEFSLAPEIR